MNLGTTFSIFLNNLAFMNELERVFVRFVTILVVFVILVRALAVGRQATAIPQPIGVALDTEEGESMKRVDIGRCISL